MNHVLVASNAPLSRDPAVLASRLRARGIEGRLVIPAYLEYLYTNDRFAALASLLRRDTVPANTDARPVCYPYTLLLWLSRFYPDASAVRLPRVEIGALARSPGAWLATGAVLLALWACRRRDALRRVLLAALAGTAGMVLETTLILHDQIRRGVLFQDLGLLLMLFMAGLALGAWVMDRHARRAGGGSPTRGLGAGLAVGLGALSLLVAWLPRAGPFGGRLGTAAALTATGFVVAALFAYAALHRRPEQRAVVSPLYAADLLGGCVGSLAASLLLVPLVGLSGAAALMLVLAVMALVLA